MYWDKAHTSEVAVSIDYDTAGANTLITPGLRIDVKRITMVCTEVSAGSSIATLSIQNVDGTSNVVIGTFVVPAGIALNAVRYVNFGEPKTAAVTGSDGSATYSTVPGGVVSVNPGQRLVITSDGVGTAGIFNVYTEFVPIDFNEKSNATSQGYAPVELNFTLA